MSQNDTPPLGTAASPAPAQPRHRVWLATLLGAVILICGMAIGSGGTILWIRHKMEQARHGPGRMHVELAARVRAGLGLTDEQTQRVEKILKRRHEALMKSHRETFKAEIEGMRAEVATVLSADQARTWNADHETIMGIPPFPPPPPHGEPPPGPPPGGERPSRGPRPWPGP